MIFNPKKKEINIKALLKSIVEIYEMFQFHYIKDITTAFCHQWQENICTQHAEYILANADLARYVKYCASLVWKMVIQKPRMQFKASRVGEDWIDDGHAELVPGSNPSVGDATITYNKHPALMFKDETLVKASAVCQ